MAIPPFEPQRWQKLQSTPLATTRVFAVTQETYRHPLRAHGQDFFVINAPDWVNVIALTADHQLVLIRQFRFGINNFSIEIPGGIIEPGEDCLAAGLRELREETGFTGGPVRLIGTVHPNPAIQSNCCHLVLVEHARLDGTQTWDPDEEMEVRTSPVDEVYALAQAGGITHALVLDALLLFAPHWAALRRGAV